MTFNEKLTLLRKNKGLTQDDFAKAIGVSRQAVYKWENGTSYPEVPKLLEIKALLEISLDDLFDDSFEVAMPEKKKRAKKEIVAEKVTPPTPVEETVVAEDKPEAAEVAPEEPAPIEEKTEKPAPKEAEAPIEKKVGFFGRIFGRK